MTHKPRIPRLVAGVDVRKLPLAPLEGFVLSRVDGAASVGDIADLTNQTVDECHELILRLIAHGAVEWADGAVSLPRMSQRPGTIKSFRPPSESRPSVLPKGIAVEETPHAGTFGDRRSEPPPQAIAATRQEILERAGVSSRPPVRPAAPEAVIPPVTGQTTAGGASAPEDEIDLPPDRRKRIDDTWLALDLLNHYELLGLTRKATRQEIRASYFERSKAFHPDTAFRKKVGNYRTKMEAIFKRLTEAYEVLGKTKGRAEYDAYLLSIGETRDAEEALSGEKDVPPGLTAAGAGAAPEPPVAPPAVVSQPKAPEEELPLPPPPSKPAPPRVISEESRRRAAELFQRRLDGARVVRTTPMPFPAAPTEAPRTREEMAKELRQAIGASASLSGGTVGSGVGGDFVQRQLVEARRAEAQGELALAVRALRMAVATAPDRADIAAEHERVALMLAVSLADRYSDQAAYEEKHGKWAAAALSWSKVLDGRPDDIVALLGAARCLLEAKGDLRKAQRFAQHAVDLRPQDPVALKLLGRVCLSAGLPLNARRALQSVLSLEPHDTEAKNLLAMVTTAT